MVSWRQIVGVLLLACVPAVAGCGATTADVRRGLAYTPPRPIDAFVNIRHVASDRQSEAGRYADKQMLDAEMCAFFAKVFARSSCGSAEGSEDLALVWTAPTYGTLQAELRDEKSGRTILQSARFRLTVGWGPGPNSTSIGKAYSEMAEQLYTSARQGPLATWLGQKGSVAAAPPRPAPQPVRAPVAIPVPANVGFGRYYALIVGNQTYQQLPRLRTPVADAQAVAALLRADYKFDGVTVLTDVTRLDIIRALDDLRRTLTEADNLLVYYAGHGYLDKDADRGYWLPIDAGTDETGNWLSTSDIVDKLRAIRAKHVLVVADSCFSGTLVRDVTIRPLTVPDLARLTQKRARTAVTSGGLEPVSDVGGGGHSVFAKAFLDVLGGVDGAIDMTTLFGALRRQVLLNSQQTPQYSDVRQAGHDGGDFVFVRRR